MFRLTIDTDNDAFGRTTGQERAELGRCLRLVAALVEGGYRENEVRNYSGNTVGQWTMDATPDALQTVVEALRDLREAATSAYKAGRISGEAFVRAGNVLDGYPKLGGN